MLEVQTISHTLGRHEKEKLPEEVEAYVWDMLFRKAHLMYSPRFVDKTIVYNEELDADTYELQWAEVKGWDDPDEDGYVVGQI